MTHALHLIWNPSEGIDLGFFMIRYYSLMFVIAFGLGWFLMKKIFERENESLEKLDSLFVWTVLATLIGARLGHVFFYDWDYFKDHLLEIILPVKFEPEFHFTGFQGLASHGAAIAIIVAMYYYSKKILKRPMLWILDRVVIPVASGAIFVRIGNFMNSEIVGNETTSPFGIRFLHDKFDRYQIVGKTGISDPKEAYNAVITDPKFANILAEVPVKHPTQLYEAFCYIFVFAILFFLYWKTNARLKTGLLFGTFLVLLFVVRFIIEFVKSKQGGLEDTLGYFSTGQWLSIPFIIIGLFFIIRAQRNPLSES
ncbi:prolipoprotein diacylglyceryl transferase [Flavobacterium sp. 17A]|uniref:Phosphatidylglycerol--prolipoprotein diacylglyceryl transferase n=1 Tax=Flavobacterium potami TaxID=2872310 RepID=A0A9X1H9P0_9FLAO|nr:prolipoprotein diacylglyceryl transferase [Flavobacterium potami]MBZ4034452.1 prolipoprotein diacylglyceryl transferase [Flavobacterium potami]